jgi:hypothetical protein
MNNDSEFSKLIRLKRHEHPGDAYFERFLETFQERQRSELLRRSTVSIFMERVCAYVSDFGRPRFLATAGACCLALVGVMLSQRFQQGIGSRDSIAQLADSRPAEEVAVASFSGQPLPLPEEVVNGPLEIYPVGIQKVGASYYLLQEPPLRGAVVPGSDRSTYRLPVIDLTDKSK